MARKIPETTRTAKSITHKLPRVADQPVLGESFLNRKGRRPSSQPMRSRRGLMDISTHLHQQFIRIHLGLIMVERPGRRTRKDIAVPVKGPPVTGAAELVRPAVPPHDAPEVRTARLVADDFRAEPGDEDGC